MRPPPRLPDILRPLARATVNRHQLRTAGGPGARAALIRHRGRRSGRTYETPVTPTPIDDGFLIALPFGDRADWVRNVLAAGEATLIREGVEHVVRDPEVVPMADVADCFDPGDQRVHRRFGVDLALRLRLRTR
ncbi:nitroreductase family deazaflavin-dependent oxidoreductase [Sporichthya polymorpha]|uniref:nitroreductase family deazaflavin-dependent oxidoreductase n=1 Tax=Sporichthya polymorpha TaxID=35751 RepID=UPI0003710C5C|nr:nitroreductase family deazaflavin-dependent oxidoreductase [Sporichthya polymorpha]